MCKTNKQELAGGLEGAHGRVCEHRSKGTQVHGHGLSRACWTHQVPPNITEGFKRSLSSSTTDPKLS